MFSVRLKEHINRIALDENQDQDQDIDKAQDQEAHSANKSTLRDFFPHMLLKSKLKYTMHSTIRNFLLLDLACTSSLQIGRGLGIIDIRREIHVFCH